MENIGLVAISRQMALRKQLAVVANNIANVNTAGYRRDDLMFQQYLQNTGVESNGQRVKTAFVWDRGTVIDYSQGNLTKTDNALDLAIQGDGFFKVGTPDQAYYTRNGQFRLNERGEIVTADGKPLLDSSDSPITVPEGTKNIEIRSSGVVIMDGVSGTSVKLHRFADMYKLQKIGGGLFKTNEAPLDDETSQVMQGMTEDSNVQPIMEMTKMTELMRDYQQSQRIFEKTNDVRREAIRSLGKLA